jgi:hypothetical protein
VLVRTRDVVGHRRIDIDELKCRNMGDFDRLAWDGYQKKANSVEFSQQRCSLEGFQIRLHGTTICSVR